MFTILEKLLILFYTENTQKKIIKKKKYFKRT